MNKKPIYSFKDLEIYQDSYKSSLIIATEVLPKLPENERFDLKDQLSRSSKAIPRLIAEGFAKKHQNKGFQKYLDDVMGECNETIVSLSHVKDIYQIKVGLCEELIAAYEKSAKQTFRLAEAWSKFKKR